MKGKYRMGKRARENHCW